MENLMLTIKWVLCYSFEVLVIAAVAATAIAGVVQIVRNRIGEGHSLTAAEWYKS